MVLICAVLLCVPVRAEEEKLAVLAIVDALQKEGFRFVTVSELAAARGVTPSPGEAYRKFE